MTKFRWYHKFPPFTWDWWLYYHIDFVWIDQNKNTDENKYRIMDYYRYFKFRISIYEPNKSKIPAFIFSIIIFGYGFEFCTHGKN